MANLGAHKVLAQWLPSDVCRSQRFLDLGAGRATRVQCFAIKLDRHQDEFPAAMALGTVQQDGRVILQCGFKAGVHDESGGWDFDTAPTQGQAAAWRFWDAEPTPAEVIEECQKRALASGMDVEALQTRIESFRTSGTNILAAYEADVRNYVETKAPSPIFDENAFFTVAKTWTDEAPQGARGARDERSARYESGSGDGPRSWFGRVVDNVKLWLGVGA